MMKGIVVVLVVAASAPALAQPISRSTGRVAQATARTRISLSPDGPWIGQPAKLGEQLDIHDDGGSRLQILDEASGAKLLLYVDRSTLRVVTVDDTELYPSAATAAHPPDGVSPGMALEGGTPIDASEPAAGGLLKVRVHGRWTSDLRVTGYMAASKIGTTYLDGSGISSMDSADVTLPVRFRLLDAPGGSPFVVSANRERTPAKVIVRDGKAALVRISEGAIGWIASSQLHPVPESETLTVGMQVFRRIEVDCDGYDPSDPSEPSDSRRASQCGPDPQNTLPVGTPLFDAIEGRAVGLVTRYFRSPPLKQDRGWSRFDVVTRYGKIGLWAQPGAVATTTTTKASREVPAHVVEADAGGRDPGDLVGVVAAPPPPPPPQNVAPLTLNANRIRGASQFVPDDATKDEIARSGKDRVIASFKLCIDSTGAVQSVVTLRSSTFPVFDAQIRAQLGTWGYRPFLVKGVAQPVCSAITVGYPPLDRPAAPPSGKP